MDIDFIVDGWRVRRGSEYLTHNDAGVWKPDQACGAKIVESLTRRDGTIAHSNC